MSTTPTPSTSYRFSARASLAVVGLRLRRLNLFGPVKAQVHIDQKVVTHTPVQQWYDAFIAILAGAHGLVEINKRLRADPGLQAAFGRKACAEQSVVQNTLDACTEANVTQMQQATDAIYRRHSWGYSHDYTRSVQVLDLDMTGMPCGKKAACATKGSCANQRNRRGRQLGRVLATRYDEIVNDRLFGGTTQLSKALQPVVEATEQSLELDDDRRRRTLWRIDAGGGSVAEVNWLLERGSQVHCKDYSGKRAKALAQSVSEWVDDPRIAERQVGWVTVAPTAYSRPVRRVAVRCRKKNGPWGVGVLIATLAPHEVIELTRQPADRLKDPTAVLSASVYLYDQRGGGVEMAIKGDKQGLGISKRNKKRFAAQQMVTQLNVLAHNTVVRTRRWPTPSMPRLRKWGMMRMVRDVFHASGQLVFDHQHRIVPSRLNPMDPLVQELVSGFVALLASELIVVTLGET